MNEGNQGFNLLKNPNTCNKQKKYFLTNCLKNLTMLFWSTINESKTAGELSQP